MTRRKTGETLLYAGGQWDRIERRFTDTEPTSGQIIELEESQVEFTRWFATWLRDFREGFPRDTSLAVAGGDRRGGKTYDLIACTLATAIDVPAIAGSAFVGWIVSVNYQERDEVDRTVREMLPANWYRYRKAPEFRYMLPHGAVIRNVSADDPETLKRGRVDLVFFNEAQKMPVSALSNGIYGTVDKGGIALLAANPPRRQVGEWVLGLKEAIDDKQIAGAKFFGFSSRNNTQIQQDARTRVGDILRVIDPKAAIADDDGAWVPVGDRAYPAFDKKRNLGRLPELGDITADFLRNKTGRAYQFVGGFDFQGTPYQSGAIAKVIAGPHGNIYWFCDEVISEQATEDDLIDDLVDKHYAPENLLCVGDASGAWQDAHHQFKGRVSFDFFKARRFHIEPPQKPKGQDKTGRSRNPAIEDRLGLVFRLLQQGRLIIDSERCPRLAEAFKECPIKNINGRKRPSGLHAHVTDGAGYLLWYLEPRPTIARPPIRDITRVDLNRNSGKLY